MPCRRNQQAQMSGAWRAVGRYWNLSLGAMLLPSQLARTPGGGNQWCLEVPRIPGRGSGSCKGPEAAGCGLSEEGWLETGEGKDGGLLRSAVSYWVCPRGP